MAIELKLPYGVPARIMYTNYKGERAARHVIPMGLEYGHNQWHPEPQWFLRVFDLDKMAERTYAIKDIEAGVEVAPPRPPREG